MDCLEALSVIVMRFSWAHSGRVYLQFMELICSYLPRITHQIDGRIEVVNQCLETYLRCMSSQIPSEWCKWLPVAEWWYNTTYHSASHLTPYEVVYNQPSPIHIPYLPGESSVDTVDRSLQKWEAMISLLKFHLRRAQNRTKQLADTDQREASPHEIGYG